MSSLKNTSIAKPNETLFTSSELISISHSLGVNIYNAVISQKLRDKTLPKEFYRNRFQVSKCETFEGLISKGLAGRQTIDDLNYYFVTKKGQKKFREEYSNLIFYVKPQNRTLEHFKERINAYCFVYNYNYGEDCSAHIIGAFTRDYLLGYPVSKTTRDVIRTFRPELNKHFPKKDYVDPIRN